VLRRDATRRQCYPRAACRSGDGAAEVLEAGHWQRLAWRLAGDAVVVRVAAHGRAAKNDTIARMQSHWTPRRLRTSYMTGPTRKGGHTGFWNGRIACPSGWTSAVAVESFPYPRNKLRIVGVHRHHNEPQVLEVRALLFNRDFKMCSVPVRLRVCVNARRQLHSRGELGPVGAFTVSCRAGTVLQVPQLPQPVDVGTRQVGVDRVPVWSLARRHKHGHGDELKKLTEKAPFRKPGTKDH
jgi:hypothetical protein